MNDFDQDGDYDNISEWWWLNDKEMCQSQAATTNYCSRTVAAPGEAIRPKHQQDWKVRGQFCKSSNNSNNNNIKKITLTTRISRDVDTLCHVFHIVFCLNLSFFVLLYFSCCLFFLLHVFSFFFARFTCLSEIKFSVRLSLHWYDFILMLCTL